MEDEIFMKLNRDVKHAVITYVEDTCRKFAEDRPLSIYDYGMRESLIDLTTMGVQMYDSGNYEDIIKLIESIAWEKVEFNEALDDGQIKKYRSEFRTQVVIPVYNLLSTSSLMSFMGRL